MKTANVFFLTIAVFFSNQLFSQLQTPVTLENQPILNHEWQQTENWLQTFHTTFGKEATANWMSELAVNGVFYRNKEAGGFIVVLPTYVQSKAKLQAKFQYGIYENKNTRLLPIKDDAANSGNLWTTRFLGFLGGVPASLDMAVVEQGGKYLTLMGFYPNHELVNDFSKKFQQFVERNYGENVFASR